jgi:phosphate-selective porin OprO/OprP
MKNTFKKIIWGVVMAGMSSGLLQADGGAKSLEEKIDELDQKIRILERQRELAEEEKEAKKKTTPVLSVSEKGFQLESADKKFSLRLRGLLQVDSRNFLSDERLNGSDGFIIRRARLPLQGKVFENFEYLFTPEFAGSSVSILDAYINSNFWQEFQVQAGKFKSPVGLEVRQSDPARLFVENALVSNLVPNRDIGVAVQGKVGDDVFQYQAGVFNGAVDGGNETSGPSAISDDYSVAAWLFTHPFRKLDVNELKGFGFGLGGSIKNEGDQGTTGTLTSGYRSAGQQTFFTYNAGGARANGTHWRLSPQGYYYYGPFGFLGEYVINNQEISNAANTVRETAQNTAWQVAASYVLTGEDASFGGVKPRKPFSFSEGHWGAFELAARYGELQIDDDVFPIFANPANQASGAREWGIGLNWYLNSVVRVSADFFQTDFESAPGAANGVDQNENAFITRLQLNF